MLYISDNNWFRSHSFSSLPRPLSYVQLPRIPNPIQSKLSRPFAKILFTPLRQVHSKNSKFVFRTNQTALISVHFKTSLAHWTKFQLPEPPPSLHSKSQFQDPYRAMAILVFNSSHCSHLFVQLLPCTQHQVCTLLCQWYLSFIHTFILCVIVHFILCICSLISNWKLFFLLQ